ncbi:hypothetical protein [Streptomyces sp. NPDC003480]
MSPIHYDLPADASSLSALGTADWHLHAATLQSLDDGMLRLAVVPGPSDYSGGIVLPGDTEEGERRGAVAAPGLIQ